MDISSSKVNPNMEYWLSVSDGEEEANYLKAQHEARK